MLVHIRKPFPYSRDGIDTKLAKVGETVDVPDALVPGLTKEGFVEKATGPPSKSRAPENRALAAAEENKDDHSAEQAPTSAKTGESRRNRSAK